MIDLVFIIILPARARRVIQQGQVLPGATGDSAPRSQERRHPLYGQNNTRYYTNPSKILLLPRRRIVLFFSWPTYETKPNQTKLSLLSGTQHIPRGPVSCVSCGCALFSAFLWFFSKRMTCTGEIRLIILSKPGPLVDRCGKDPKCSRYYAWFVTRR